MEMAKTKLLIVTHEMSPFLELTKISEITRQLPQAMQEKGFEIRILMPKFGNINERRNRLHEVIRLSGMNIIIDDNDNPLIIKVASIPAARMQVYFLDNEEYFQRIESQRSMSMRRYNMLKGIMFLPTRSSYRCPSPQLSMPANMMVIAAYISIPTALINDQTTYGLPLS